MLEGGESPFEGGSRGMLRFPFCPHLATSLCQFPAKRVLTRNNLSPPLCPISSYFIRGGCLLMTDSHYSRIGLNYRHGCARV